MVELLTRPRGRSLSAGRLFGFDPPDRPTVDVRPLLARQRERDRQSQFHPPEPASRYLADPRFIVGLACPTEVLGSVKRNEDGTRQRTRFDADAFDAFLWELHRGLRTVALWLRHNEGREIGDTTDHDGRFLRVFLGERGLMFAIDTETARGSIVRSLVRRRPEEFGECSIGAFELDHTDHHQAGGVVVRHVHLAMPREISLVPRGSMPGTWIR